MMLSILWFAVLATALQEIFIYTKDLYTSEENQFGVLKYSQEFRTSSFEPKFDEFPSSPAFSICTNSIKDIPECFAYHETNTRGSVSFGGLFELFLNSDGKIEHLSFKRLEGSGVFNSQVVNISQAPKPNLTPLVKEQQKQQQTKKVLKKKTVTNEQGEQVEIEEESVEVVEADNRSWVQKNWMYIVPPLLIFFVFSGSEAEK